MVPTKTKVTFDKGGKWQALAAPKRDHNGEPIECEGCALHLNGKTSGFLGPVYSKTRLTHTSAAMRAGRGSRLPRAAISTSSAIMGR
jgi:hypothetical protein